MDIHVQRKIDRAVGVPLCWIFSFLGLFSDRVAKGHVPSKILVILLSEMGSLVLARPMFDLIRVRYPSARLYALCFKKNREVLDILGLVPAENIITIRGDSLSGLLLDTIAAVTKMRREQIDTVIDCELFSRVSSLYSFLCGAKVRVGFHRHTQEGLYRGSFINRPVLYNPYHHISEQFVNLVEAIGTDQVPRVKRIVGGVPFELPRITIGEEEKRRLLNRLESDFPQILGKRLVLIYPGGGLLPIRAWPWENFCSLSERFLAAGYAVGIVGMESDKALAGGIVSRCRNESCVDLTGYTSSVRELMALFHLACLLITNDGGPGHFASMTPIPSIVFFGPETPVLYRPLDKKSIPLHASLSCSPCLSAYNHRNSPCDGDNRCLKVISPEEVLHHAHALLNPIHGEDKSPWPMR